MSALFSGGQSFLPGLDSLETTLAHLAEASIEERGAVFTRREVVEFILDLAGYTADLSLHTWRVLEPSFGAGDFLFVIAERLLAAYSRQRPAARAAVHDLRDCIRAVELHSDTYHATRAKLLQFLVRSGLSQDEAEELVGSWLIHGDFLLTSLPFRFNFVVGNPPYVRQELIPDVLLAEYRRRYRTIFDRADLYVPFYEKSLQHLEKGGSLSFICADRWIKNRYGAPLRALIANHYHLKYYVDMVGTQAFHSDVIAYPAITTISSEPSGPTRVAHRPPIEAGSLVSLARAMTAPAGSDARVLELTNATRGSEPWVLETSDSLAMVRRLEATFPTLEEAGCKVGIGVATGADGVYIAPYADLDVEPDRKLPLVMTRDIQSGTITWRGLGVVNPFDDEGELVNLAQYPQLRAYLMQHEVAVRRRHVAQTHAATWYRTIDRIYPALVKRPKLLIPDIKGNAHIVLEDGHFYPHHNLYYILSDEWDLRGLQAVLLSGIARLFVSTYSTKMRGEYLRFQAQYLRRIRLPRWGDVPVDLRDELVRVAATNDHAARNAAVSRLYGLSVREQQVINGNGG